MESVNLGEMTDLEVLDGMIDVNGMSLIDMGCAGGNLARALAARGATVLGIEPDPIQARKNRDADPVANVTLTEGDASRIPVEDDSIDGVFFSRSLHHVPHGEIDAALTEAHRVLKPGTGFLFVIEPIMEGQFSQLMKPFNDETQVRKDALAALERTAAKLFPYQRQIFFTMFVKAPDFETFVARTAAATFRDNTRAQIETDEVRANFEAGRTDEGYRFEHPMRINFYRDSAPEPI